MPTATRVGRWSSPARSVPGSTRPSWTRLQGLLEAHASDGSPFRVPLPKTIKGIRWVEPALVVEVEFAEWTSEGRMRHPAYLGQRIDADPRRVIREPG